MFAALAVLFLILSLASYSASTLVLNHVGNRTGVDCATCTLVEPLLIKTVIYGAISGILGGLAVWSALRKEKKQLPPSLELEMDLYPGIKSDVETNTAEEQAPVKAERS